MDQALTREQYSRACAEIRQENREIMAQFRKQMEEQNLTVRTIEDHMGRIDLYINHYLLDDVPRHAAEGPAYVTDFISSFLLNSGVCTLENIRSTMASFRKFYTFMESTGRIDQETYRNMSAAIRKEMPGWTAACAAARNSRFL